jgi:hypothetical protein
MLVKSGRQFSAQILIRTTMVLVTKSNYHRLHHGTP